MNELSTGTVTRSDLYALGAIGYELLSGQPPFEGDHPLAVMSQHLSGTIRPLTEVNPTVPPTLDRVIRKALRRQPSARYQTVEAFRQALLHHPEAGLAVEEVPEPRGFLAFRSWLRRRLIFL